jgi:hypothetical protein
MTPSTTSVTFPRRQLVRRFTSRFRGNVPRMPRIVLGLDGSQLAPRLSDMPMFYGSRAGTGQSKGL